MPTISLTRSQSQDRRYILVDGSQASADKQEITSRHSMPLVVLQQVGTRMQTPMLLHLLFPVRLYMLVDRSQASEIQHETTLLHLTPQQVLQQAGILMQRADGLMLLQFQAQWCMREEPLLASTA